MGFAITELKNFQVALNLISGSKRKLRLEEFQIQENDEINKK